MTFKLYLEKYEKLTNDLIKIAKDHLKRFPDMDYGKLFYHPLYKKVHFIKGDGAEGWKEAEKEFKIDGIKEVVIADEWFPKKDEQGWIKLL